MEQIDERNKKTLLILWILTFLIALIGATFGYFSATSESDPQIITTQSLSVGVAIEGATNVDKIKPTTWNATDMSVNENNTDITVIPFRVTSTSGINGTYTIDMSTNITENALHEGGSASDIKYRVYKGSTQIGNVGSFTTGDFKVEIVNGDIAETGINDQYKLYVYIENKDEKQNKLQGISFDIVLSGTASQN